MAKKGVRSAIDDNVPKRVVQAGAVNWPGLTSIERRRVRLWKAFHSFINSPGTYSRACRSTFVQSTTTMDPTKNQNGARQRVSAKTTSAAPPLEVKEHDFFWTYTEEPHRTRRQAIIKAHPEVSHCPENLRSLTDNQSQVTKLCGPEPLTKYIVLGVVALQVLCAYLLQNTPFFSWKFFLTAYVVGATANQNLFLAIHEISHNLAFRSASANRMMAIFANLPIAIPYSASFRVCKPHPTQTFRGRC